MPPAPYLGLRLLSPPFVCFAADSRWPKDLIAAVDYLHLHLICPKHTGITRRHDRSPVLNDERKMRDIKQ